MIDSDALLWRDWSDESVVYNAASGDTHLFDVVQRTAVQCLASRPLDESQLCEQLSARLQIPADDELAEYTRGLLHELQGLDLIEVVDA